MLSEKTDSAAVRHAIVLGLSEVLSDSSSDYCFTAEDVLYGTSGPQGTGQLV